MKISDGHCESYVCVCVYVCRATAGAVVRHVGCTVTSGMALPSTTPYCIPLTLMPGWLTSCLPKVMVSLDDKRWKVYTSHLCLVYIFQYYKKLT